MTENEFDPGEKLMNDYRMAGGSAREISDLSHPQRQPAAAIPVLARWLSELDLLWPGGESEARRLARLTLIHALTGRESRRTSAIPALLAQLDSRKEIDDFTRWSAGNALYEIPADDGHFDEMARIAQDRSLGTTRQMVVNWLGKSQRPEAAAVASSQLDDETVQGHALDAMSRLRAQGVRNQVEPFTKSKNKWHRRSAERIIRYLED
ncbi:HEAT repeat domain-containing protein [Nocardia huaxiensis]|uniref:HEAT repeat domain-containing protein n=1 Tax=Nocardia huaxiensis TaxID=2755382 RepID=UPI001E521C4E|nr:HEAT repeat domain-containing protein [Nocardia huaxiensis]UFS99127.1 HEAT repeat domain-containing protein [Nocardia huaxiensis]